jgi:hypothetical protein
MIYSRLSVLFRLLLQPLKVKAIATIASLAGRAA